MSPVKSASPAALALAYESGRLDRSDPTLSAALERRYRAMEGLVSTDSTKPDLTRAWHAGSEHPHPVRPGVAQLLASMAWAEVDGGLDVVARRMVHAERMTLSAALSTGDKTRGIRAYHDAMRVLAEWGIPIHVDSVYHVGVLPGTAEAAASACIPRGGGSVLATIERYDDEHDLLVVEMPAGGCEPFEAAMEDDANVVSYVIRPNSVNFANVRAL